MAHYTAYQFGRTVRQFRQLDELEMEITKDQLLALLNEYSAAKEAHLGSANGCAGAVEVVERLIEIMDTKEEIQKPEGK